MMNHAVDLNWTIPQRGEIIAGKYVVEGECGRGGLAVVLSAHHAELDRRVAIKMLLPAWAGDRDVIDRFLREGRAATRIGSEHVVRVFDVGILQNGAPYLVLEYLDGHNLEEVVHTWGMLPIPTAIDWLLQATEAIAEAHAYGIVHRDLKPANLFLTQRADGTASIKVIDFGLSKITDPRMLAAGDKVTQATDIMGSPHYMAPEQLRSTREADARSDIWGLGVVLFELLTGRPPFTGDTIPELCASVLTQPPPRLATLRANVPPAVEVAVFRCLQKEPSARFGSVAEMARALAPYGTTLSRASCDRIERTLGVSAGSGRFSISLPPMPVFAEDDSWADEIDGRALSTPASARVVLGSLSMLTGLFVAVFLWLYADVHGHAFQLGAAESQATINTIPTATPAMGAEPSVSSTPAMKSGRVAAAPNATPPGTPASDGSSRALPSGAVGATSAAPTTPAVPSIPAVPHSATAAPASNALAGAHAPPERGKTQHERPKARAAGARSSARERDGRADDGVDTTSNPSASESTPGFVPAPPAMREAPAASAPSSPAGTAEPPPEAPSASDPTTYVPPASAASAPRTTAPVEDNPYDVRQ